MRAWSTITNKADKDKVIATIDIDGFIGFDFFLDSDEMATKEAMKKELKAIDAIEADEIIVNINSFGGDINHGLSIHDLLKSNKAKVTTIVNGLTASAATVIAQAGDIRKMSDNALYLIHNASTLAYGNKLEVAGTLDELAKVDSRISNIYAKRSGKRESLFIDLMNENNGDGKWIDAKEAKKYGLIDEVFEPTAIAAYASNEQLQRYKLPIINNKSNIMDFSKKLDEIVNLIKGKTAEGITIEAAADSVKKELEIEFKDQLTSAQVELVDFKNQLEEKFGSKEIEKIEVKINNIIDEATKPMIDEINTLKSEIEKYKGTQDGVAPSTDPSIQDNKEVSGFAFLEKQIINRLKNR